mgnify:CR=1 FL=1
MPSRRAVLGSLALAALGGCAGSDRERPSGDTTSLATDTTRSAATSRDATGQTTAGADTPRSPDLDPREANVLAVEVERRSGGHRFSVTLQHDDDGEDGYANWWVVESLDGTELGRRELLHPHGNEPFTRSATVETGERACVVVRGHDETHGYGGEAALVSLDPGEFRFASQGPDRRSFDASDCP